MADFAPLPAGYDDTNRAFLQAIMSRGSLSFTSFRPILAAIFSSAGKEEVDPDMITVADLESFITAANAAISPFDYEIRSALHQLTKEKWYAVVNVADDAMTQIATVRTPDEMAFIKRVLDAMFETYNTRRSEIMAVSSMQAMKVAKAPVVDRRQSALGEAMSADKGLTGTQAERLMKILVEEGWLERSNKGFYTLSPRALMELKGWLVAAYNDPDAEDDEWQHVKNCYACKQIITVGERCPNWECNVRLHSTCAKPFWRQKRDGKCPQCATKWGGAFVGEKALDPQGGGGKGSARKPRSRPQVGGADGGGEEDAEGEEDDASDAEQDSMAEGGE